LAPVARRTAFGDVHHPWGRILYSGDLNNVLPDRGTQTEIADQWLGTPPKKQAIL
jgi:hypothetical protein